MCDLIFSTNLPEIFLILQEMSEILLKMCIGLRVKCPLLLLGFVETSVFSAVFRKKILKSKIS